MRIVITCLLLDLDVVYCLSAPEMFPSFDDMDYEFESEIKKTRELSCVLDFYANSIRNAQEDGFKKLIQIIESRNLDSETEEVEHEIHELHEMFMEVFKNDFRVQCHNLSVISSEASNVFLKLQDIRRGNVSERRFDLNLYWINILKLHDDCLPLLLKLFRDGDMCRDELNEFFRHFDVQVLPWEVLKNFELNMLCIRKGVYFYRNVAGVLREVSELINMN